MGWARTEQRCEVYATSLLHHKAKYYHLNGTGVDPLALWVSKWEAKTGGKRAKINQIMARWRSPPKRIISLRTLTISLETMLEHISYAKYAFSLHNSKITLPTPRWVLLMSAKGW